MKTIKEVKIELKAKIKYMDKVIKSYDNPNINGKKRNVEDSKTKKSFFEGMRVGYVNLLMEL